MAIICGIDEAGRGSVLGSLIIAGVVISENKLPELKKLGVRDSKLLSPRQREKLFKKIVEVVDSYKIIEISPREIDQRNAVGTNLNRLEAIKIAQILSDLQPDRVFVDSPEPQNSQKFAHMISQYLEAPPEIIAEHRADSNYLVCGAASILAKVRRDSIVNQIEKEIGYSIGSGYPSDPICQKFLENHYSEQHSEHIRKTWITYKLLKSKKSQTNLENW